MAHCWAHARRKLKEVFDRDGSQIAAEGLRRIAEFYAVESDIRGISPGQRLSARQTGSAPLVAAFGDWLQAERRKISAKSRLGEKLNYIYNHWEGLQTFLTDGRVEIDNNRVENLIRPITLNRKNAIFAGHDEGGIAWGRIASLIETCKINDVEPFAYLKATLTAIANGHPQSGLDEAAAMEIQAVKLNRQCPPGNAYECLAAQTAEIFPIAILAELLCAGFKLDCINPAHLEGDLVGRTDLLTLPFGQGAHKITRIQKAGMGAGVQPGKATPHFLHA